MEKCFADVMYPCGSALQIIWLEPQSHARIIGYFKVPAKHADQVLSQSGRQSAFFQIMQTDVDKENTKAKIRWLERGEQNAVRTPGFWTVVWTSTSSDEGGRCVESHMLGALSNCRN